MYQNARSVLAAQDHEVMTALAGEEKRQLSNLELIASENFVSQAVLGAQGSVLTNKYAEGYPGRRYYGGCQYVDITEQLAIDRAKELFGAEHANVQPHSGAQANMAVYYAFLNPGDRILGMDLNHGGHLTHGMKKNFSGTFYESHFYRVEEGAETIDYEKLAQAARDVRPRMIVAGASAYSRFLDFERFRAIADEVDALLLVDMAHIAGLVAAGLHPSPVPYADVVTTTTHKTLRGPRGGLILCKEKHAKKIDSAVFPGLQGGPLEHVIAAKAVALGEALRPQFKTYQRRILDNCRALADSLINEGFRLVSGGSDNHLLLVDCGSMGLTGHAFQEGLDAVYITCNKNAIPFDTLKPTVTSGVRVGTPALTTRGFTEEDFAKIGRIMGQVARLMREKLSAEHLEALDQGDGSKLEVLAAELRKLDQKKLEEGRESSWDEVRANVRNLTDGRPLFSDEWLMPDDSV